MKRIRPLIEDILAKLEVNSYPMVILEGKELAFESNMAMPCCFIEQQIKVIPTEDGRWYDIPILLYLVDIFGNNPELIYDIQTDLLTIAQSIVSELKKNNVKVMIIPPKEYNFQENKTNYLECGISFEVIFRIGKC